MNSRFDGLSKEEQSAMMAKDLADFKGEIKQISMAASSMPKIILSKAERKRMESAE